MGNTDEVGGLHFKLGLIISHMHFKESISVFF